VQLHSASKENDCALKVAVANCGETESGQAERLRHFDQSEWKGRVEAEGYRQLPQMRHRALELM
jgi:hypothetical protein